MQTCGAMAMRPEKETFRETDLEKATDRAKAPRIARARETVTLDVTRRGGSMPIGRERAITTRRPAIAFNRRRIGKRRSTK